MTTRGAFEKRARLPLSRLFSVPLNQNYKGLCQAARMHSFTKDNFQTGASRQDSESDFSSELEILRDVLRLLPSGVTVQDEQGEFLLVNDAAAAQLQMAAGAPCRRHSTINTRPASICCVAAALWCWRKR